jgi:hypothetical protein
MKDFFRKLNSGVVPTYDEVDKLIESLGPLKTNLEELRAAISLINNGNRNPKVQNQVQNLCESLKKTFIRDLGFVEEVEKKVEASSRSSSPSDLKNLKDLNGVIDEIVESIILILEKRNFFKNNRIFWNDSIIDKEGFLDDLRRTLIYFGGRYYNDSGVVKRIIYLRNVDYAVRTIFGLFYPNHLIGCNRAEVQRELKSYILGLV